MIKHENVVMNDKFVIEKQFKLSKKIINKRINK